MKMPIKVPAIGTLAVITAAIAAAVITGLRYDKTSNRGSHAPGLRATSFQTLRREPAYCSDVCFEEGYFDRISPSL